MPRPPIKNPLPADLVRRLNAAHAGLLRVHKALLDLDRARYEQERGPIGGPGNFLQLLIHDPFFAWLHPVSELAALIDEATASRDPGDPALSEALLTQSRELLTPTETGSDFQRAYHQAIQASPTVAAAHADWRNGPGRE